MRCKRKKRPFKAFNFHIDFDIPKNMVRAIHGSPYNRSVLSLDSKNWNKSILKSILRKKCKTIKETAKRTIKRIRKNAIANTHVKTLPKTKAET